MILNVDNYKLVQDKLLVKESDKNKLSEFAKNLPIPDNRDIFIGTVVKVGEGHINIIPEHDAINGKAEFKTIPVEIEQGDIVYFHYVKSLKIMFNNESYHIIRYADLELIIKEKEIIPD